MTNVANHSLSVDEAMHVLAHRLTGRITSELEGIFQFEFTDDSNVDYHLVASHGTFELRKGRHESPHLTMRLSGADYQQVLAGKAMALFANGRLQIEGDMARGAILARTIVTEPAPAWRPDRARIEATSSRSAPFHRIERRDMASKDDLREKYASPSRPVVLTDALRTWELASLTLDRLKADLGHLRVNPSRHAADAGTQRTYASMSLAEFIDVICHPDTSKGPLYLSNQPLPDELLDKIDYPPFFSADACGRPSMWLGPYGTKTSLHRDLADNMLVQIFGKKQLVLLPPEQASLVYAWENSLLNDGAKVDPEKPDLARFPLYAQATPVEFTLEAGEMLFLPAGWFHHVRALPPSPSLSISFFKLFEAPAAMFA